MPRIHYPNVSEAIRQVGETMVDCLKSDALQIRLYAAMAIAQLAYGPVESAALSVIVDSLPLVLGTIIKVRTASYWSWYANLPECRYS